MNKETRISSQIDNELFSETDIDFVEEKVDANLPMLLEYGKYLENERKLRKINLELVSTLNEQQTKLFREYQNVSLDSDAYHKCLAYYIGLKSKIETEKLK